MRIQSEPNRSAPSRSSQPVNAVPAVGETLAADWKAVAEALQLDVIVGRLQFRERLVEDELIARFGVSRYAVRRAIDELQALGLVVREENRGARIRGFTAKEVADLFELREMLESGAALRITTPVSEGVIEKLTSIQRKHDLASQKGNFYQLFLLNDEFHDTLFACCNNEALSKAISNYSMQAQPIRMRFVYDEARRRQVAQEHWDMIAALKEGDTKTLSRLCGRHIALTKQRCLAYRASLGA